MENKIDDVVKKMEEMIDCIKDTNAILLDLAIALSTDKDDNEFKLPELIKEAAEYIAKGC